MQMALHILVLSHVNSEEFLKKYSSPRSYCYLQYGNCKQVDRSLNDCLCYGFVWLGFGSGGGL